MIWKVLPEEIAVDVSLTPHQPKHITFSRRAFGTAAVHRLFQVTDGHGATTIQLQTINNCGCGIAIIMIN